MAAKSTVTRALSWKSPGDGSPRSVTAFRVVCVGSPGSMNRSLCAAAVTVSTSIGLYATHTLTTIAAWLLVATGLLVLIAYLTLGLWHHEHRRWTYTEEPSG